MIHHMLLPIVYELTVNTNQKAAIQTTRGRLSV